MMSWKGETGWLREVAFLESWGCQETPLNFLGVWRKVVMHNYLL